jgi:hypothetical protein
MPAMGRLGSAWIRPDEHERKIGPCLTGRTTPRRHSVPRHATGAANFRTSAYRRSIPRFRGDGKGSAPGALLRPQASAGPAERWLFDKVNKRKRSVTSAVLEYNGRAALQAALLVSHGAILHGHLAPGPDGAGKNPGSWAQTASEEKPCPNESGIIS